MPLYKPHITVSAMWAAQLMRLVKPLLCHIILIVAPDLCILLQLQLSGAVEGSFWGGLFWLGFIKKLSKGKTKCKA